MTEPTSQEERWIRPSVGIMHAYVASTFAFMYGFLGLFTAYAWIWWPAHRILDNSLAEWSWRTATLASIFAAPFLIAWFWYRRLAWHVGPHGIIIRRGLRPVRSLSWDEVFELVVLLHSAVVRARPRQTGNELGFLTRSDCDWLREFARGRVAGPPPRAKSLP